MSHEPTSCPRVKKKWFCREIRLSDTGSGDDLVYEVEYDAIPRIAELLAKIKTAYLEGYADGHGHSDPPADIDEIKWAWRKSWAARDAAPKAKDAT